MISIAENRGGCISFYNPFTFNKLKAFKRYVFPFIFNEKAFIFSTLKICTVKENECHTARFPVRRFDCFDHLYKGILKQMIPHLKALIFSY